MPSIADMLLDGNLKVSFVPAVANIAAPTVAELTAGVGLEERLTPDGLNISFDTSMIDNSALNSTYDTEQVGRSKVTTTLKYKAGAVGTSDDVRDALTFRAVGFLVVRRGVDAAPPGPPLRRSRSTRRSAVARTRTCRRRTRSRPSRCSSVRPAPRAASTTRPSSLPDPRSRAGRCLAVRPARFTPPPGTNRQE
jgi:hypothetical protein